MSSKKFKPPADKSFVDKIKASVKKTASKVENALISAVQPDYGFYGHAISDDPSYYSDAESNYSTKNREYSRKNSQHIEDLEDYFEPEEYTLEKSTHPTLINPQPLSYSRRKSDPAMEIEVPQEKKKTFGVPVKTKYKLKKVNKKLNRIDYSYMFPLEFPDTEDMIPHWKEDRKFTTNPTQVILYTYGNKNNKNNKIRHHRKIRKVHFLNRNKHIRRTAMSRRRR